MDCPTCGKSLSSERGMRQHHTKVHDEPLPNRTCEKCDERFYDPKSRRTYCEDCYTEAGELNGNWKDAKQRVECVRCGSEFEYYPSDKDGVYCPECVEEADEFLGTPSFEFRDVRRIDTRCEYCGESFSVLLSTFKRRPCRFCSQECLYNWMSDDLFQGHRQPNAYNGDWRSVRAAALERDNHSCQSCGTTAAELGQNPDVHHIVPIRTFDNPDDAHELDNVISLCKTCHMMVEHGTLACPDPIESRKR